MSKNIIAVDIGTQSSRASVVTQDGKILGIQQIAHALDSPHPSWAQQNPDSWWEETCRALQEVLRETVRPVRPHDPHRAVDITPVAGSIDVIRAFDPRDRVRASQQESDERASIVEGELGDGPDQPVAHVVVVSSVDVRVGEAPADVIDRVIDDQKVG